MLAKSINGRSPFEEDSCGRSIAQAVKKVPAFAEPERDEL